MKRALLLTLISLNALGKDCGSFEALKSLQGRTQYGNCKIELHLCESDFTRPKLPAYLESTVSDNMNFWMGDLLVTDELGRSVYMPLYSTKAKFLRTAIQIEDRRREFNYTYRDKNIDPVSGLKEFYELKINKRSEEIEINMKNSLESKENPIRSLFFPNLTIKCNK